MAHNKKEPEDENVESHSFSDEVTANKIEKHWRDINDIISDDDIKNVKVDTGTHEEDAAGNEERDIPGKPGMNSDLPKNNANDNDEKKIITPVDLLGE